MRCERCGKLKCKGHEEPSTEPRGRGSSRAALRRQARKETQEHRKTLLGIADSSTSAFPIEVKE